MYEVEIIAALGIFLGCFSRAILPWLRKKSREAKAGQQVRWENRYTWTLIFDIFVAVIATMLILPSFSIPMELVFPYAFIFGWASQDIVNQIAK